jgi:hypothetical protein
MDMFVQHTKHSYTITNKVLAAAIPLQICAPKYNKYMGLGLKLY